MTSTDWLQPTIEVAILLLLFYLAFLKSYSQEKGKNLATKEDVEEITSMVESVKSQLQFSLQAKLSLAAEEHEALVAYFSRYHAWLAAITNCDFSGLDHKDASCLGAIRDHLDALQQDFDLANGRLELFVENPDITLQHGKLIVETLKYQAHAQRASWSFEHEHLELQRMKLNTPQNEQLEKYRLLWKRQEELYRTFKEEQLEMYATLLPLIRAQRSAISAHIKKLVDG